MDAILAAVLGGTKRNGTERSGADGRVGLEHGHKHAAKTRLKGTEAERYCKSSIEKSKLDLPFSST